MKAIFDSSPLIFLTKLGMLKKVLKLFEDSFTSLEVKEELFRKDDEVKKEISEFFEEGKIKVISYKNVNLFRVLNKKLGKGESAVIVVALENFSDSGIAILDDYVARKQATNLGLKVKGTLGIIKRLKSLNEIDIDPLYLHEKLISIGFRIKKEIFLEIFKE